MDYWKSVPTLAPMRKLIPLILAIATLASACVAGEGNVVSVGPANSVTTLPPLSSDTTADTAGATASTQPPESTTTTEPQRPHGVVTDESVFQYVVVYDPEGGFVTGGGWIDSITDVGGFPSPGPLE